MKAKEVMGKLLMSFVLLSIGFAAGKEMTRRAMAGAQSDTQQNVWSAQQDKIIVYYMHGSFRCLTCNSIETMTKGVVENDFAEALAAGQVAWQAANIQENVRLGRLYGVSSSTVVVAKIRGGEVVDFKRLDEVWTKVNDPPAFKRYIHEAIVAYLEGGGV
ncbi:MAG: hypothetical protein IH624_11090 [Phycisphaerae bacterium]|nr:hypothetical protein [Phycisphaerae bacterium]